MGIRKTMKQNISLFGEDDYEFILLETAGWIKVEKVTFLSKTFETSVVIAISDGKKLSFSLESVLAVKKSM